MDFTSDWFTQVRSVWDDPAGPLGSLHRRVEAGEPLVVLEIGAWEGRSTSWLIEQLARNPGSKVVSVDHFDGGRTSAGIERNARLLKNVANIDKHNALELHPTFSSEALMHLRRTERCFDFAYIDGSHHRLDTMDDAIGAWRCLNADGVLIFDDYDWDHHAPGSMEHPRAAIDSFVALVQPEAQVLHKGYQIILRKTDGPRHAVAHVHSEPLTIVLAADQNNAAPLAVAMHSIICTCSAPQKLLFTIIDHGLEEPGRFVELAELNGACCLHVPGQLDSYPQKRATWAKLWLDVLIPSPAVIIYADADILCRWDVLELRELGGMANPLAAVADFDIPRHFNAGLMLLNLNHVRTTGLGKRLRERALLDGEQLPFGDQDVLNAEVPVWAPLPIYWNVQGLGTHSSFRTRAYQHFPQLFTQFELEKLVDDPHIVQFTGEGAFSVAACFNKYGRCPTKPWVPLCNNPYRDEWFEALSATFMRGWRLPLSQTVTSMAREALSVLDRIADDVHCIPDGSSQELAALMECMIQNMHCAPSSTYEIAVLLPLRCTHDFPVSMWVQSVNASFRSYSAKLFIGVDEDDPGWAECKQLIQNSHLAVPFEVKMFPPMKPAIICPIWASLALTAYCAGCSYMVLWGDDVSVEPNGWFDCVKETLGPGDLGCVAPIDTNDPSLPTFPIVTRAHFDLFGSLFSPRFINQDADPYLFELYRRVGRSTMLDGVSLTNLRGGASTAVSDADPRYVRQPLTNWKDEVLLPNAQVLINHVLLPGKSLVTIDVVVPSFRTPFELLRRITSLDDPVDCSVKFIIIVDDPAAPALGRVLSLQSTRVRVRVNTGNLGASASRNRGLSESCADWVLFLDDDVEVNQTCLDAYARAAATQGARFSGFVGTTTLPPVSHMLYEATRLSDITFFYDLPGWMGETVPWGVTANIMVRRMELLKFDTVFAKTGGGEDVDYCICLVQATGLPLGRVVEACVTHDWWPYTQPLAYMNRFWKWTMGDGHLNYKFPQHVYLSFPNVIEWNMFILSFIWLLPWAMTLELLASVWLIEFVWETRRALSGPASRHLSYGRRFLAALVSPVLKNVVDFGHLAFHLRCGRFDYMLHRFDWFLGHHNARSTERQKFFLRNAFGWVPAVVLVASRYSAN